MPVDITHHRTRLRGLDTRRAKLHADQAAADKLAVEYLRKMRLQRRLTLGTVAATATFSISKLWDIEHGLRTGGTSLETFNQVVKAIDAIADEMKGEPVKYKLQVRHR